MDFSHLGYGSGGLGATTASSPTPNFLTSLGGGREASPSTLPPAPAGLSSSGYRPGAATGMPAGGVSGSIPRSPSAAVAAPPDGNFGTYNLLVYIDKEEYPVKLTCTVDSVRGLVAHLQHAIERPIARVSVWDTEWGQYIPLSNLSDIKDFKARIAVDTGGVRLTPVREDGDALEWNALREHVDKLGPPREGCSYQLVDAHRIVNPQLERAFQGRRTQLNDPKVRTMMLFYTNNARPSEQVVQNGFAMPVPNSAQGQSGIVFATDIDAQPAVNANLKFLLCEVAVGRTFTVRSAERLTSQLRGFDVSKYDSLLNLTTRTDNGNRIDEWVIFNADQAIPRYVITCNVAKGATKVAWNFAAMGCERHPGESLKLWCVPCRELMCPYCMTIGAHKGHEGKEVAEVATFEKHVVMKMAQTLDKTLSRKQEEVAELERARMLLGAVVKKGEENIHRVVAELHQLLAVEEQQLMQLLVAKRVGAAAEIDRSLHVVQQTAADLSRKQHDVVKMCEMPVESSTQAAAEFLSTLQPMLDLMHSAPAYDDTSTTTVNIPDLAMNVEFEEARHGIQSMALVEASVSAKDGSAGGTGAKTMGGTVPKSALDNELARLRDLETGYIWVIPNAAQHFAPTQSKDVFSDVFSLLGVSWELRVASQPEDHVSVFLHAANHVHRMDFRVTLVSPNGWYTRHAKNWLESFRGRGWGIKPYADKRTLLSTYIHDGVLKVVVTPTSGLY